jgi:hypothetical protein
MLLSRPGSFDVALTAELTTIENPPETRRLSDQGDRRRGADAHLGFFLGPCTATEAGEPWVRLATRDRNRASTSQR